MSEHDALLQAVLADPAADLPRLVYADFIEERFGQTERAEFIRVQIELAQLCEIPSVADATRRVRLRERERELCPPKGLEWLTCGHRFHRGFISEVSAPLDVLMGGECDKCEGDGVSMVADYHRWKSCKTCHGTGRTPGILPRLVREQPIEFVKVTDKRPQSIPPSPSAIRRGFGNWWGWYIIDGNRGLPFELPLDLLDRLRPMSKSIEFDAQWPTTRFMQFSSCESAEKALSDALLEWAKQQHSAPLPTR